MKSRPGAPARGLRALLALLTIGAPLGCAAKTDGPTRQPETNKPVETKPIAVATGDESCRDWSDLDVSTLQPLPKTPHTAVFEHVWTTVLHKHYDKTLACLDWPKVRMSYGSKLSGTTDASSAYKLINDMLAELKQSHLGAVPPSMRVQSEPRAGVRQGQGTVPVKLRYLNGELIVADQTHGLQSGLPLGASIVQVDDHAVAETAEKLAETTKNAVEIAFQMRRVAGAWMSCNPGEHRTVTYRPHGSEATKTRRAKCQKPQVDRISMGNLRDVPVEVDSRMIEGTKVGYLRFNIWMVPLMQQIRTGVATLRANGMESLVIDLRGNPGGVGAMSVPLARMLLSESASLGSMHMRVTDQHFNVEAGADAFAGPVAILVDEGTGSTSEIFAQALKDLGRVKVFGSTRSMGAALPSLIEKLPDGGVLQYVVADYKSPTGTVVEGRGVQPDVLVTETASDYAAGNDKVLNAAVEALTQS